MREAVCSNTRCTELATVSEPRHLCSACAADPLKSGPVPVVAVISPLSADDTRALQGVKRQGGSKVSQKKSGSSKEARGNRGNKGEP